MTKPCIVWHDDWMSKHRIVELVIPQTWMVEQRSIQTIRIKLVWWLCKMAYGILRGRYD